MTAQAQNPHSRPSNRLRVGAMLLACLLIASAAVIARLSNSGQVPHPPSDSAPRIVSLSPAIAITLRDLGFEHLIVGRDAYDRILPASIPVCGDYEGIDYEHLLGVRPTHILMQLGTKQFPGRLEELAQRHNWTLKNFPQLSLEDIQSVTKDLQALFAPGSSPPAVLKEMDRAWSKRGDGFAGAGRILLLAAVDPPSAFGPGSCHHQILERIGGTPAIRSGSPYITFDAEDVRKLNPDGIIVILPREPGTAAAKATPGDVRRLLGRAGELDISAIKSGRLALIDDPLAHTPSSAMVGLADQMADILEGWNVPAH